jgi:hypothetical protein
MRDVLRADKITKVSGRKLRLESGVLGPESRVASLILESHSRTTLTQDSQLWTLNSGLAGYFVVTSECVMA